MAAATPTGLVEHDEALIGPGRRDGLAVDPLGLFGEPEEEVGGVPDLVARHPEGLALLLGHEPGQVLLAFEHEPVGLGQQGGPSVGRARPTRRGRPRRRRRRRRGVLRAAIGYLAEHLPVAGFTASNVRPDAASTHFPSMNNMSSPFVWSDVVCPLRSS